MKSDIPNEVVQFQPDAIQIRDEKLPLWARMGMLFSFLFFLSAVLWSWFARVDVIVQAPGKVVSDKQTIAIKPIDTSIIEKVHVNIGDIVKKGDTLISFDQTINQKEIQRLEREVCVIETKIDRFRCEFYGQKYVPAASPRFAKVGHDVYDLISRGEKAIFDQRQKDYSERISYYDSALNQMDASRKTKEDNLKKQEERLKVVWDMERMYADLREKKAASLRDLWSVQISRMEMEANKEALQNSLDELRHQRDSILAQKNAFVQEWRNNISEELVKLRRELDANVKTLDKNRRLASYVDHRAPCDAMVHEIAPLSVGSAAREGETVMTLIPLDGNIEVEAEIRPQDISRVRDGSNAKIKLDAYPFQKYGTMDGRVRYISHDTMIRQQQPTIENPNQTYYRARVSVSGKLHRTPRNFRMIPGMVAQVEIKVGRRRVIEYVVHPLIKMFDEAAREP